MNFTARQIAEGVAIRRKACFGVKFGSGLDTLALFAERINAINGDVAELLRAIDDAQPYRCLVAGGLLEHSPDNRCIGHYEDAIGTVQHFCFDLRIRIAHGDKQDCRDQRAPFDGTITRCRSGLVVEETGVHGRIR